ncbi:MAG: histidine kinase, partial [Bacteroidota bacterium]
LLLYAIFVGIITILGTQSIWQQIDSGGVPRGLGRVMVSHEAIGNFTTLFAFLTAQLFYARKNHTRQRTLLQKEIEITQLSELRTKAELETLTAKTNPHFLYNSLNTIAALAKVDANKTQKMAIELSDFLKYSTNRKEQLLVPLAEEIRIVQTYLSIEKIRFQDQLSFQIQVDEDAEKQLVPRFLLQPLVENAIKHGYQSASTSVQLLLVVTFNNGLLTIKVADSGPDFKDDFIPGHGLDSVSKKLQLLFPNRHTLAFINQPNKHIRITLESNVVTQN